MQIEKVTIVHTKTKFDFLIYKFAETNETVRSHGRRLRPVTSAEVHVYVSDC